MFKDVEEEKGSSSSIAEADESDFSTANTITPMDQRLSLNRVLNGFRDSYLPVPNRFHGKSYRPIYGSWLKCIRHLGIWIPVQVLEKIYDKILGRKNTIKEDKKKLEDESESPTKNDTHSSDDDRYQDEIEEEELFLRVDSPFISDSTKQKHSEVFNENITFSSNIDDRSRKITNCINLDGKSCSLDGLVYYGGATNTTNNHEDKKGNASYHFEVVDKPSELLNDIDNNHHLKTSLLTAYIDFSSNPQLFTSDDSFIRLQQIGFENVSYDESEREFKGEIDYSRYLNMHLSSEMSNSDTMFGGVSTQHFTMIFSTDFS